MTTRTQPENPRHKAPPRAPRHPTSCRRAAARYSKLCCADFRAALNRKFRRDNRRYLHKYIQIRVPAAGTAGEESGENQ